MKVYWSIKDLPELANLTKEQQQAAFQYCSQKYIFKMWETWLACAIMSTLVTIGAHILGPIAGAAVGGAIGGGILGITITHALRPYLKAYVMHHFAE
jgi:uncharacterized membrane protein